MEIRYELHEPDSVDLETVVTIGAYDGVHLGHRRVIAEVCRISNELKAQSAVVTFDRHPASVVRPESAPLLLTDLEQKLEQLETTGVDVVQVVSFDKERADESAEEFVVEVLVRSLATRTVIVGEDFHFGRSRQGNVDLLRRMGFENNFEVHALGLVGSDGSLARDHEQVSSTFIRRALAVGDLSKANGMLGRRYEVRGVVDHGDGRGKDLGFPTANVRVDSEILLPADGVYAALYRRPDGLEKLAAVSLGTRPHFYNDGARLLEAHLLDTDADLYGEKAQIQFASYLRPQQKFDDLEDLISQLHRDVENIRTIFL